MVTPAWWSDTSTQFGFLKTWRVDDSGTYLDNERISKLNIRELDIDPGKFISVQIGIPEDAENQGGMNLFGEGFGDYAQPLVLRLGYQIRP